MNSVRSLYESGTYNAEEVYIGNDSLMACLFENGTIEQV